MSELERLLGRDNLSLLSRIAGGTKLAIPKHCGKPPRGGRDGSVRLKRMFGESLATLLVFHFANRSIYIPSLRTARPFNRKQLARLKQLERQNLSAREIARRLGCTERAVVARRAARPLNGKTMEKERRR